MAEVDKAAPAGEWVCHTPGGPVRLADLPLEALADLEQKCGGQPWSRIVARPRWFASNAIHIYAACCAHAGCEPATITARQLLGDGVFQIVADDLPDMYEGGIPKAGAGPLTSGSPGVLSGSGGLPPK